MRKTAKLSRTTTRKSRRGEIRRNPRASGPKKNKTVKATSTPAGVQKHGKEWENAIITVVVSSSDLEEAMTQSHTATHDVPKHLNKKKPGTHLSIKATGSNRVDFGDAKRTIQNLSKPDSPLEAIVVRYRQSGAQKIPSSVLRIDLTAAKEALLGSDPKNILTSGIDELDKLVKKGDSAYKDRAKHLQKYMKDNGASLVVAPKIGNPSKGRSGRLQISLSNITEFARKHPQYVTIENDCQVYGKNCLLTLESARRVLPSKTKSNADSATATVLSQLAHSASAASDSDAAVFVLPPVVALSADEMVADALSMFPTKKKDSKEDNL
jgi:hypothetical protein